MRGGGAMTRGNGTTSQGKLEVNRIWTPKGLANKSQRRRRRGRVSFSVLTPRVRCNAFDQICSFLDISFRN
jgi:hypothetical protein